MSGFEPYNNCCFLDRCFLWGSLPQLVWKPQKSPEDLKDLWTVPTNKCCMRWVEPYCWWTNRKLPDESSKGEISHKTPNSWRQKIWEESFGAFCQSFVWKPQWVEHQWRFHYFGCRMRGYTVTIPTRSFHKGSILLQGCIQVGEIWWNSIQLDVEKGKHGLIHFSSQNTTNWRSCICWVSCMFVKKPG